MSKKKIILEYCQQINKPVTAKNILQAKFPDKQQPYINSTINELVMEGKLVRNDTVRPYTVRLPEVNEPAHPIKDYSRANRYLNSNVTLTRPVTVNENLPDELKKSFNEFWSDFFERERNYYQELSFEKLVQLKMIVSKINNLITYESTKLAAEVISDILELSNLERAQVNLEIHSSNVNSNGYDIEHKGNNNFVCEVKANIPAGGRDVFGAAQEREIRKDFSGLINGKNKSQLSKTDLKNYFKFMCFYSGGSNSINAVHKIVNKLNKEFDYLIELWCGQENLVRSKIYVILVTYEEGLSK